MSPGEFPRRYGRYELLAPLSGGGMGQTFKARVEGAAESDPLVVIKTIHPELARDAKLSRMFIDEAHLVARLVHPNIVKVFDLAETEEGGLYMALEYVDGVDLRQLLEHASERHLVPPVWFPLHVVSEVLRGLEHAHGQLDAEGRPAPVVHRDVTPSNILLSMEGEVKLSDFGIAVGGTLGLGAGPSLAGKAAYMAPELLEGRPIDARVDVFSVGVVLWESLALRPLFAAAADFDSMLAITQGERPPPSRFHPGVSAALDEVVLTALEPDPSRRFESAARLRSALEALLEVEKPDLTREDVRRAATVLTGRAHPTPDFLGEDTPAAASGPLPVRPRALVIPSASTTRMPVGVLSELVLHSVRATLPPVPVRASRGPRVSLRQQNGRTISPLSPLDALTYLASEDIVAVSVGEERWLDREYAALLAGAPDLLAHAEPAEATVGGELSQTSPLAAVASLALQAASGRLFIESRALGQVEVDVSAGRPTFVRTENLDLRTHLVLSRSGLLPASEVESLLETCFESEQSLESLVARARGVEPAELRSLVLGQELSQVLALEEGRFWFDPSARRRAEAPGKDELAPLLFRAIELGLPAEALERRLRSSLSARLEPVEGLATVVAQLPLATAGAEAVSQALDRVCQGAPPRMAIGEVPGREKHRLLVALYLLHEIGLLRPSPV